MTLVEASQAPVFENNLISNDPAYWKEVAELRNYAARAQQTLEEQQNRPFSPLGLTLYLSNRCNLSCVYCFAESGEEQPQRLVPTVALAAAKIVAENCLIEKYPLTVAFTGGGEPTLEQPILDTLLDGLEQLTTEYGLALFRYISTNGVMEEARARWLAQRFDLISLSCDGPPPVQAVQRPLRNGCDSSPKMERTAQIVRESGKTLHVRVTVTRQTLFLLPAISRYLCCQIEPKEINVEPVYRGGRATGVLEPEMAGDFVEAFLEARKIARDYGVRLLMSGSRPGEIHGPYCQVLRDVLHLLPGGEATACFKTAHTTRHGQNDFLIGQFEKNDGVFNIDQPKVRMLRQTLQNTIPQCSSCFNLYHCARGCPDFCVLEENIPEKSFRCLVQQMLISVQLQEIANTIKEDAFRLSGVTGKEVGRW
ncbi:hypothetical protein OZ401_005018 (plasmid) [Candidatus Chlorohelix allophototropha]|uniref:Radical SAM core domain-containing protein n=1 Tax=Candidatus Chlorohelix allophototropha TaxID=3003348 RepID=A0ABY9BAX4_9CHLR|nr:hypothetical protein OZ401_005018 [Chloroflexota bacterium L227-S17]